jgi:SAM-dependent methyltransferase
MDKLEANKTNWNLSYGNFNGWGALPTWGPYEVGKDDPSLIGDIEGKTFVEIACGSGHSVKYLLDRGARKVYGLDFSEEQIRVAEEVNAEYVKSGRAEFHVCPMEERVALPEEVDTVFSIYGLGWTVDPVTTLKNIYSYLKPGGRFVWSWDHSVLSDADVDNGTVVVKHSYHDESEVRLEKWSKGDDAYITYRKTSTWFALLRDAGFTVNRYLEPEAVNLNENIEAISGSKMAAYYAPEKVTKLPWVFIFECIK